MFPSLYRKLYIMLNLQSSGVISLCIDLYLFWGGGRSFSFLSELTSDVFHIQLCRTSWPAHAISSRYSFFFSEDCRTWFERGNVFSYSFVGLYALHLPTAIISALSPPLMGWCPQQVGHNTDCIGFESAEVTERQNNLCLQIICIS